MTLFYVYKTFLPSLRHAGLHGVMCSMSGMARNASLLPCISEATVSRGPVDGAACFPVNHVLTGGGLYHNAFIHTTS